MGYKRRQKRTAIAAIASLFVSPGFPGALLLATAPAAGAQGMNQPSLASVAAKTPVPSDGGWPRTSVTASGATLIVYQPQLASWANQKHAVFYSAISYMPQGAPKAALGTVKVESDTSVSVGERLVNFSEFKITESNFPTLQRDQLRTLLEEITTAVPLNQRVIALDRVLANINKSEIIPKNVEGVKADPPTIFFSTTPAVLVNLDGDPIWSPITGNDLKSAVYTNWDLFEYSQAQTFYLRDTNIWLKASDVKGPWEPAGDLRDGAPPCLPG